ncbi:hypothetical protein [Algoriphagus litoralis]|uniref:hypothetical protein n=1 Tax=Algoriphagus litoralis TaxID=2202829 RepID=UPI000DB9E764|nr:hypothetical protein [Algoriphagus litoralis]
MCTVLQLLESCTCAEKDQLLQFCRVRHAPDSKKVRLLNLFLTRPGLSDSDYSKIIYRDPDSSAYPQLKKRLKEELEELILLLKHHAQTDEMRNRIECSELLLRSQVLLARGLRHEGAKLLEKCLKKAIREDFADLTLSIFDISQRFKLEEVLSKKDLPELELVIKSHLQILVNQYYAQEKSFKKNEKNTPLSHLLRQLNYDRKNWGRLADIRQSISKHNFEKAAILIQNSESNFADCTGQKEAFEEFSLVKIQVLLYTQQFGKAIQNCTDLKIKFCFSHEYLCEISKLEWYARFHLNQLDEALQILKKQLFPTFPNESGMWKYLEAVIHFRQKNLKKALLLAHECQGELKNFPNYYLGSKMLELMILFEQNDQDWLDYKIDSLRKLVCRWKGKLSARIETSFSLFMDLHRQLPGISAIPLIHNSNFRMLEEGKEKYAWLPIGFELVRYDRWISEKINHPVLSIV